MSQGLQIHRGSPILEFMCGLEIGWLGLGRSSNVLLSPFTCASAVIGP